jgi:NSS family neurotransmitter:Na+ symporter
MIVLGSLSSLGNGPLSGVTIIGMQFLDFFDFITNSVMMPMAALATCLLITRYMGMEKLTMEVEQDGHPFQRKHIFSFMIRFLCPLFVLIILVSAILNVLGIISM